MNYHRQNIDLSPGLHEPLCGWDWVREHEYDPPPPCSIEIINEHGTKFIIKSENQKAVNEAIRVITK